MKDEAGSVAVDRPSLPREFFDRDVVGGNYTNHYGNKLKTTVTRGDRDTGMLLRGINVKEFVAGGSLYKVSPLSSGTDAFLFGRVEGHPPEPIAWTFRRDDGGKSFYTSLGHVDDFAGDVLPQLLLNAISWATQ